MEGEVIDTFFHADRRPQGHFNAARSASTLLGEHPAVADGWQAVLIGFCCCGWRGPRLRGGSGRISKAANGLLYVPVTRKVCDIFVVSSLW